jgi:hypothetical protein
MRIRTFKYGVSFRHGGFYMGALRGATAYEAQVGRLCLNLCYLRGDYWKWRPWRRVKVWWDRSEDVSIES